MWMRHIRFGLGVFCAIAMILAGCPSSTKCSDPNNAQLCNNGELALNVTADSDIVRVERSGSTEVRLTLERTGDWTGVGPVVLRAEDLPDRVTMDEVEVPSADSEVVVTLMASGTADSGVFPFRMMAQPAVGGIDPSELAMEVVVPGAPGAIDETFQFNGELPYSHDGESYESVHSTVDSMGRLWLLGWERNAEKQFMLRVLPDGTFDTAFSEVFDALNESVGMVRASSLRMSPDGHVLVGGTIHRDADTIVRGVVMINENGELVTEFGDGGKVLNDVITEGFVILPRKDDMIFKHRSFVLSYLYNGEVNTGFHGTGTGVPAAAYYSVGFLRSDESVLVLDYTSAARATIYTNSERILLEGSYAQIESKLAALHDSPLDYKLSACVALPDKAMLCAGYYLTHLDEVTLRHAYVFRLDADANIDPGFGDGGFILRTGTSSTGPRGYGVYSLPDGRFLVGMKVDSAEEYEGKYVLACYNPDGSLDESFGDDGVAPTSMPPFGIYLDSYGRILTYGVAGESLDLLVVARYWL